MRFAVPGLALLIACSSDAAAPDGACTECAPSDPILALVCSDGEADTTQFAAHFEALDIYDRGTGRTGFPDAELGARFSRKATLELRATVVAPLNVFVCVRNRSTNQVVLGRTHAVAPPAAVMPLGQFPRDRYVLQLRSSAGLLRQIPFASE
jgi:hypothetical protein